MAEAPPPPDGPDTNNGPAAMGVAWTECSLATIVVVARFYVRVQGKNLGLDDWMMAVTVLFFIAWSSLVTWYAELGGFRHEFYLVEDGADSVKIGYVNYLIQTVSTLFYAPGKTAVALLVLRIIGSEKSRHCAWRKWLIYISLFLVWTSTIANCVMAYAQCSPPAALWDPSIPHECWDPLIEPHFAFFSSSCNVWTSAVLAVVPASVILGLNMCLSKRIQLSILLGLGIIAAICGIVKTSYLGELSAHSDITWETYNLIVWAGSELFVLITCGSLPTLKPIWDRIGSTSRKFGGTPGRNDPRRNVGQAPDPTKRDLPGPPRHVSHHAAFQALDAVESTSSKEDIMLHEAAAEPVRNGPIEGYHPGVQPGRIRATTEIEVSSVTLG